MPGERREGEKGVASGFAVTEIVVLGFVFLLGILLIARSGLSTRTVRIADKLSFSTSKQYSKALK